MAEPRYSLQLVHIVLNSSAVTAFFGTLAWMLVDYLPK
ncbi:hypothetical protein CLV83_2802 [Marinobacterium mangrovicola]|uniref:Uncharacterized protein n=1 Tax=Marinobacterium mangrovicola TaxID=1476959 RepID=A0A4R1GG15_9GAMM|nr:hypothetical protein CLV83_2802 [Marinobacterium mangrovicola]